MSQTVSLPLSLSLLFSVVACVVVPTIVFAFSIVIPVVLVSTTVFALFIVLHSCQAIVPFLVVVISIDFSPFQCRCSVRVITIHVSFFFANFLFCFRSKFDVDSDFCFLIVTFIFNLTLP